MRALLLASLVMACGPKVSPAPPSYDEGLDEEIQPDRSGRATSDPDAAAPVAATRQPARPVAAPGKALRTGTIARARMLAVLDAGPGQFLRQLEVAPRMAGNQFIGWQLVQLLDPSGPLHDVDLAPGDVLHAINQRPVSRPEQLQVVWDSLRTANEVTAQMTRGDRKHELRFAIEPAIR